MLRSNIKINVKFEFLKIILKFLNRFWEEQKTTSNSNFSFANKSKLERSTFNFPSRRQGLVGRGQGEASRNNEGGGWAKHPSCQLALFNSVKFIWCMQWNSVKNGGLIWMKYDSNLCLFYWTWTFFLILQLGLLPFFTPYPLDQTV